MIPSSFTTLVADCPRTTPYVRHQAEVTSHVTSRRHTTVELSDLQRLVLHQLDGTRNRDQITDVLIDLAKNGQVAAHHDGKPVTDAAVLRKSLEKPIDIALKQLAKMPNDDCRINLILTMRQLEFGNRHSPHLFRVWHEHRIIFNYGAMAR